MKPTLLLGFLLMAGANLHAQVSLLPYAGFEQSRNGLSAGNGLSTSDINGNLKAGLRMGYQLKGGHLPFINLTTNPAPVSFAFNKAGSLLNNVAAVRGSQQLRLEAGYQLSTKPIRLGKKQATAAQPSYERARINTAQKKSCGSATYRSRCGARKTDARTVQPAKNLNMRLQPSVALAYVPSQQETVKQTADGFTYAAGTWKTALVPAMGFTFAKGQQQLFTLTAFYTQPLRLRNESVATQIEGKTFSTQLQPTASTWGLTFGVPLSFGKPAAAKATKTTAEKRHHNKPSYRTYRKCMRVI